MSKNFVEAYKVKPQDTLTLTITIGYAQDSSTTVKLDDIKLKENIDGSFSVPLPEKGSALINKKLKCSTRVGAISPVTNKTSVTFKLMGGLEDSERTLEEKAEKKGQRIQYRATYKFISA